MKTSTLQSVKSTIALPAENTFELAISKYLVIVSSLFILANGIFFGGPKAIQAVFNDRIMPLVQIDDHKVGGKTTSEVKRILQAQSNIDRSSVVRYDAHTKTLRLSDLGIIENTDQTINSAYRIGRSQSWLSGRTVEHSYSIDTTTMQSAVTSAFGEITKPATDAQIAIQDGQIVIAPSFSGVGIDWELLMERALRVVNTSNTIIDLPVESTSPTLTTTSLHEAKTQAETWLSRSMTLNLDDPDQKILLTPKLIGSWIEFSNENNHVHAKLSQEKMKEYIALLAAKYNRKMKSTITYEDGEVYEAGMEGREIDQNKLLETIVEELDETRDSSIQIVFKNIPINQKIQPRGYVAGRDAGKYIEVNLAEQKMYTFEGDTLIASYPVSTGKWSMPTPEGEFAINNKVELAYSGRYKLYMPNWMAFIGSKYGIHGLPYRGDWVEGENHLGKPVSHGCIRLSWADVETVYNWAEIGTKIFIHN